MATLGLPVPFPEERNDQEARQVRRVQAALINPGEVLAIIERRVTAEPYPQAHPLQAMICRHLERGQATGYGTATGTL